MCMIWAHMPHLSGSEDISFLRPLCFEAGSLLFLMLCASSGLRIFHMGSRDQAQIDWRSNHRLSHLSSHFHMSVNSALAIGVVLCVANTDGLYTAPFCEPQRPWAAQIFRMRWTCCVPRNFWHPFGGTLQRQVPKTSEMLTQACFLCWETSAHLYRGCCQKDITQASGFLMF